MPYKEQFSKMQSCTDILKLCIRTAWHLTKQTAFNLTTLQTEESKDFYGFLIFFVKIYKQLTFNKNDTKKEI